MPQRPKSGQSSGQVLLGNIPSFFVNLGSLNLRDRVDGNLSLCC
ncbi:MAG: hypothetical protein JWM69_910 [Candidatus Binatus sp.]|jgi:hypothetical protein|nr:hypothetical protein [Candidatus Binatus sp.]